MQRIISMLLDSAIAALILIPWFYQLDKRVFHNPYRTVGYTLFAVYLCGMFAVAGLPDIRYIRFDPHYNIVPFLYMFSDLENTLLNVLLFIPLGFFLTVLWQRFHGFLRTVLFGLFCSLFIESLQIFTYRATDINDLMTNTLGAFLGWGIGRLTLCFFPSLTSGVQVRDIHYVCTSALIVMVFIHPYISELFWFLVQ